MNTVILSGKIIRIKRLEKVVYATICANTKKEAEFISVTIFNKDFFNKYFYEGKWITIQGHIHINNVNNTYDTEIIADEIYFCGNPSETDKQINALYNGATPDEVINQTFTNEKIC